MRKPAAAVIIALLSVINHETKAQFSYSIPFPRSLSEGKDTVTVMIVGDIMMHSRQLGYDHREFLSGIAPAMNAADICIANMEFSLGGPPYSGYPAFSTPDSYAGYLAGECGTDIFLTANNHILDRGSRGLSRTLATYSCMRDSLGVRYTGTARDSSDLEATYPLIVNCRGIRLAIVNFTYGTNAGGGNGWPRVNYMRKEEVGEAMRRADERGADFTIVLPHWGNEYELRHSRTQEEWAEWLVKEGADVIVGAHPHVVQDTTHIAGRPVIYSIGNTISNMSARNTRLGLAVSLRFVNDPEKGDKYMLEPELHFIWCSLPGMLTDNYTTIFVKEWANRRDDWLTPSDFDNMTVTLERVRAATGISD